VSPGASSNVEFARLLELWLGCAVCRAQLSFGHVALGLRPVSEEGIRGLTMSNTILIVIVVVLAAALALAWLFMERRRHERLRTRFGPEYERTVRDAGDPRRAESMLESREKRVSRYQIRALSADESRRFGHAWQALQARFVDDPSAAVSQADTLVTELMTLRGYPMTDFDRRAEDLSVDHPIVVQHYRDAHEIAERHARNTASTEDLRQALVHYRALFEDLLEVREPERRRA
jgi:hypothetical protein